MSTIILVLFPASFNRAYFIKERWKSKDHGFKAASLSFGDRLDNGACCPAACRLLAYSRNLPAWLTPFPALQLPLAGQSKDRDSSKTGLIGPFCLLGLATPQLTASKPYPWLPFACSQPLLLLAFWLLDYLLAAETGFLGYATLLPAGLLLRLHAHDVRWLGSKLPWPSSEVLNNLLIKGFRRGLLYIQPRHSDFRSATDGTKSGSQLLALNNQPSASFFHNFTGRGCARAEWRRCTRVLRATTISFL